MIDYSIIGKRFGRLVVVELDHIKNRTSYWLCECDCGNFVVVNRCNLNSGDTRSCGCYRREHIHEFGYKHGLTHSKLYSVWSGIVQRCTNKNAKNYSRYGGRGIHICDEWRSDFKTFYDWAINNGYSPGLLIDRIDNSGDYEPSNCRWTDRRTQQNNRRNNHYFEYDGTTRTIAEWSRLLDVNQETLRYRVINGNLKDFENYKQTVCIECQAQQNTEPLS